MTKIGCLGCTLIGIGPCVTLFICTIAPSPLKVIILTASGFFWLISLLLTSVTWFAFRSILPHLFPSLVFAVVAQELMRFVLFKLILKADDGLRLITDTVRTQMVRSAVNRHGSDALYHHVSQVDTVQTTGSDTSGAIVALSQSEAAGRLLNHRIVAYVAGLGYGLMGSIVELLHLLIISYGPGIGPSYWESKTFFLTASFEMMCISMMQIFWSLVLFNAYDQRKWAYLPVVYLTHLGVSALSLLNKYSSPWPEVVCLLYTVIALLMALLAYFALDGRRIKQLFGWQHRT